MRARKLDIQNFLAQPGAPTVTPTGTTGATNYSYVIVALGATPPVGQSAQGGQQHSQASTAGTTATGNASLTVGNFNHNTWSAVPGVTSYDVYRTVGGATQGKIGNTTGLFFDDTGLVADGTTAPATNNSGFSYLWVEMQACYDLTFEISGTFVATLQVQGSITGAVWDNIGAGQTAAGFLTGSANAALKTYSMVRVQMTAYTSGTPVVWAAGHEER